MSSKTWTYPEQLNAASIIITAKLSCGVFSTTYGSVGTDIGLCSSGNNLAGTMGKILGDMARDDAAQGKPLRAACVVLKRRDVPGIGFYKVAHDLGLIASPEEDLIFFKAEQARAQRYWLNNS